MILRLHLRIRSILLLVLSLGIALGLATEGPRLWRLSGQHRAHAAFCEARVQVLLTQIQKANADLRGQKQQSPDETQSSQRDETRRRIANWISEAFFRELERQKYDHAAIHPWEKVPPTPFWDEGDYPPWRGILEHVDDE